VGRGIGGCSCGWRRGLRGGSGRARRGRRGDGHAQDWRSAAVEVEAGWGIWVEGSAGELRVRVGEATGAPKVLGEESSRVGVGFGGG
jgi:hypothetical protein